MGLEAAGWQLARAHAGGFNYFSASTPITDPKNLPYLYHIYNFLRKSNKFPFWQASFYSLKPKLLLTNL
jgi:hypothetical protein